MTVLRSGSATDVGRVRTINQDLPLERPNLYAVADGMGGHVGGEIAARVAVETLERAFERTPTVAGLLEAFTEANAAVWQESQANTDLRGMGTTLTAMGLVGRPDGPDVLALANVGDSRAYVFSEGRIVQVTDDHSLAEERMRHGEMTEAEAAVHPQRHILTRALGVSAEVEADMWELELRTGDRVLLCSDGLSNEVGMDEMAEVLGSVDDPGEAAHSLVDLANEHGGADNITVVVIDVQVGENGGAATAVTPLTIGAAAATTGAAEVAPAAGVPETAPADPPTAMVRSVGATTTANLDDTLAPGSRLGFADESTTLAESGPRSDEFFLGTASAVPVARATARAPPPAPPRAGGEPPPGKRAAVPGGGVSGYRGASRRGWPGSSFSWRPYRSPRTSCSVGTPTTTGSSRCRATRSSSCRGSRAASSGSTPRSWTGPARRRATSSPLRFRPCGPASRSPRCRTPRATSTTSWRRPRPRPRRRRPPRRRSVHPRSRPR